MIHHVRKDEDEEFNPSDEREFHKVIDVLDEFKEKQDRAKGMTKEEQVAFWDREQAKILARWPDNLLTPPECDLVVENWGTLSFQGYGDIVKGMKSEVYREAIKAMDLDECSDYLGDTVKISEIPKTINLCLVIKIEELVKQKLIDDGHDPDDVSDSSLYWNSPLDVGWTSPHEGINEAAMKIMREE